MKTKQKGYLAELWAIGGSDSNNFVLLLPDNFSKNSWWVVNGAYTVFPNKEKGTIAFEPPYGSRELKTINCTYIGDVWVSKAPNGDDNYNTAIWDYEVSGEIVSKNKVVFKNISTVEDENTEAPF